MKEREKEVRFLNRDFDSLKEDLEDFLQVYYPDTYNDFSESALGSVFIDLTAYVGDVLSFYTDSQFKELLIQQAEERENIFELAKALGYRPKVTTPASTTVDVFIQLPAKELKKSEIIFGEEKEPGDIVPDLAFAPIVEDGMIIASESIPEVKFRTLKEIDFGEDSVNSPVNEIRIFEENEIGEPETFLIRKQVEAVAGNVITERFNFGSPERFTSITLSADDVIEIIEVQDSDGNQWDEVDFLAQETVFKEFKNTRKLDEDLSEDSDVRFVLDTVKQPRRFTRRVQSDGTTVLQFGSGISSGAQERIIPDARNIGNPLARPIDRLDAPIDPENFVVNDAFGQVPQNTTLTVTYTRGGGVESNVPVNDLTRIDQVNFDIDNFSGLDPQVVNEVRDSIAVINKEPATGGGSGETVEEIRQRATAFFAAQNRAVTKNDYRVRALSMPSRYGSIAKAFVSQDEITDDGGFQNNPLGINLYTLGYDNQKNLKPLSDTVKRNLKTFLSRFRMMTDGVNIKDGFVVNLQVDVEVVVFDSFNKRSVLLDVIDTVKDFFDIDKMQFNQPIVIGELENEINAVQGVQNISNIEFTNVFDEEEGYSGNIYDLNSATKDGVIFPSLDPSIFEVRFPNKDIKVRGL